MSWSLIDFLSWDETKSLQRKKAARVYRIEYGRGRSYIERELSISAESSLLLTEHWSILMHKERNRLRKNQLKGLQGIVNIQCLKGIWIVSISTNHMESIIIHSILGRTFIMSILWSCTLNVILVLCNKLIDNKTITVVLQLTPHTPKNKTVALLSY